MRNLKKNFARSKINKTSILLTSKNVVFLFFFNYWGTPRSIWRKCDEGRSTNSSFERSSPCVFRCSSTPPTRSSVYKILLNMPTEINSCKSSSPVFFLLYYFWIFESVVNLADFLLRIWRLQYTLHYTKCCIVFTVTVSLHPPFVKYNDNNNNNLCFRVPKSNPTVLTLVHNKRVKAKLTPNIWVPALSKRLNRDKGEDLQMLLTYKA